MFGLYPCTNLQSSLVPKQYLISVYLSTCQAQSKILHYIFWKRARLPPHRPKNKSFFLLLEQKDVYQRFSLNIKHNFLSSFHMTLQALKDEYWILDGRHVIHYWTYLHAHQCISPCIFSAQTHITVLYPTKSQLYRWDKITNTDIFWQCNNKITQKW